MAADGTNPFADIPVTRSLVASDDPFADIPVTGAPRGTAPAAAPTFVPFTAQQPATDSDDSFLSRLGDFLTSTHEVPAVAGTERAIANIPSHIADSFLPQVNLNTSAQDVASGLARKNVAMLGGNASTTEIMLAIENAVQNVNRPGSAGTFDPFAAANAARQIDAAKQNPLTRLGDLIAQAQAHAGEAGQPSLAQPAQNTSVGDVLGALQMPSHDLDWMTDPRYSGLRAGEAALGSLSHLAGLIPYGSDHSLGSDAWMRAEDPEVASLTDLAGQIALTSAVPSIGLGDRFAGIGKAINAVGIKGAVSKGLVNTVDRLPGGAVGFGAPAAVQTYEAVKNAGGSQKEAIEDASAQLGLRTLMGSAPLSSELGATNKFVRAAARGTTAGAGALGLTEAGQALNHALAPDVMPSLDQSGGTSPYMPGAIALMAALLGHRAHPEGVTAKAPENAKGASVATDTSRIEAVLKQAGFTQAQIDALKRDGSLGEIAAAATPAPRPAIEGPSPDAPLPANATRALPAPEAKPEPLLQLPPPARQLPPPTIAVDSAGNAATGAQAIEAARAADAAAQDRQNLGLTPYVERAQQARQAGVQAAEAEALQRGEPGEVRAPEPQPARAPVDPALEQRYFDDLDKEIGWDQMGGSIVRRMNSDTTGGEAVAGGDVVGRMSWIGKPRVDSQDESDFWRARPANARLTPDKASAALAKARAGEPLKPIEQRFVDYARQQAHDYAQEHADEAARQQQALQEQNDIERQQDIDGLRNEAAQFHSADANDALAYHQWVARALDAGVPVDDIPSVMGSGTLGERVQRLAQAIRERGGEHGSDTGADGFDRAGNNTDAREGQDDELPPARDGAAEPSQQPRGDLFAAATGADQLRAAREAKDAERNGLNRHEPTPAFTGTDLGATPHGEAPEQAGFGTTQVPAKLAREGDMRASRPTGGSVPETPPPVDEISEHHLSPEDQELVRSTRARAAESRDNRAAESTLEQDSRERGEREAGELGLRGAVVEALGPERVAKLHFVHDADGLPEDVRRRGTPIKRGNVRYGLHTPEGDSYIFTKHANTPERAAWTAIHEVGGHGGVQELVNAHPDVKVGTRSVKEAYESARKLFLQNPTVAKLADVIGKQRGSADRPRMAEEAMAELQAAARTGNWDEIGRKYGVEVPKGLRQGVQGAIANFVRRLKAILNAIHAKITGKSGEAFTDADVHDMLSSMWEVSQGERGSGEHLASEEPKDRADTMGRGASGPTPDVTGIKNAQTAKERAARGLDELNVAGRRSHPQVWDAAEKTLHDDPMAGERLAQEVAKKARALTPEEGVMLAQDRARLTVERHKAAEAVNEAVTEGDTKAEVDARGRLFDAGRKLEINDVAGRNSGYEQGLALSVRQIMAKLDYSLEGMEARLQAAKGEPLNVDELKTVKDLHEKMQASDAAMAGRRNAQRADQKETKAQLGEQLKLFRDQYREAQSRRDTTRQKQLAKQILELGRRIAEGDYSKVTRTPIQYNQATQALLAERNRLRNQFENQVAKHDRMNRSTAKKVYATIHDLQMGSILLSFHVFKKLAYAVGGGHALSLLADATRSVARHVPGIKGVAEQAPQYGRGIDLDALKARVQGIMDAPREAKNQFMHGESTREAAFGHTGKLSDEYMTFGGALSQAIHSPGVINKVSETVRSLAGYVGRSHAAEKEFLAQPEFREAVVRESKFLTRQMEKAGKSEDEIAEFMSRETTQAAIGTKALERAYESKMQGKNAFSQGVDAMIGTLDRSDNAGANFLGFMLKTIFPIRKVGVNVAIQGSSMMFGGLKAAAAALKKGGMTPERADYIMKNIGQQGAGAVLLTLGAIYFDKFGGVPGVFSKKDQPKHKDSLGNPIKPGAADGFGTEAFHGAPAAMIQVGASMAQVFNKEHGKHGTDLALDVIAKPTLAWMIRTIPYTDTGRRMMNTAEYGRGQKDGTPGALGEIGGGIVRGTVVPGVVQQYAAATDPYKGFRRPRNFAEDIKLGIPGLREQVPQERHKRH